MPQVKNESALAAVGAVSGKRQRNTYNRPCSSSAGSPDESMGKEYRISPRLFTATRKRMVPGVSSFDATNLPSGDTATPKTSSSFENETDVFKTAIADIFFECPSLTAPAGWQLGMLRLRLIGGISFNLGSTEE